MAFYRRILLGDKVVLTNPVKLDNLVIEKGVEVTITNCSKDGYSFVDSKGNKAREIDYSYFKHCN